MSSRYPKIMLLNPPMLIVKPSYFIPSHARRLRIPAINPGLLIIASYLDRHGINVKIADLSMHDSFHDVDCALEKELTGFKPDIVGVGSTSAFDYLESLHLLKKIKEFDRSLITLIGGQQAGPLGEIVFKDSDDLDILCTSEGEWVTLEICRRFFENESYAGIPGTIAKTEDGGIHRAVEGAPKLPLDDIGMINLPLYPNFKAGVPYIEQSRGCSGVCSFCLNRQLGHTASRVKSRDLLEKEMSSIYDHYGKIDVMFVLAANFGATIAEALEFAEVMKSYPVKWAAEFRVDMPWEGFINRCNECGLIFAIIGLESTIPSILKRMRKTPRPEIYLQSFRNLVRKVADMPSLYLTVNMMTYVGMKSTDLMAEYHYLSEYAHLFNTVSYLSVYAPEASDLMRQIDYFSQRYGCSLASSDYAAKTHLYPVNISQEISYEESAHWCDVMVKYFNHHLKIDEIKKNIMLPETSE